MSIETLDYTVNFNGHTVTCFEVGSVPTIGYASLEDAMTDTNPVNMPEVVFDAACALLDQGIRLTTIYVHMDKDGYAYMNWDEIPEELTAEDITLIEGEESVHKSDKLSRKVRRSARRKQNAKHKKADRLHGKGTYIFHYKENGELKEAISGNEYRNWATWVRTMHSWGDPEGKKRKIPRTQSVNVHKDTVPVPEQEPTYVGFYGTLEVRKGINVTMEWNVPEAVQGEPV